MKIEVMDTTLRDGEQTPGLAFSESEKFNIAKMLLEEVCADRIEVASARVSQGEQRALRLITNWCKERNYLDRVEVLGFVDEKASVDWICDAGGKVLNLLCKGSLRHVVNQLKKTPEQHMSDINNVIFYAISRGLSVNLYLEDWSSGMKDSQDYVFDLVNYFAGHAIGRFMLPDTLGILTPDETYDYCRIMIEKYPDLRFDFHAHNDYDLAVANTLMAVKAGVSGIHTTVNGLGERTGNVALSSIVGVLRDHCKDAEFSIDETKLHKISKFVEVFSGVRIPANKPIIGENVFTQTCGIHADGDNKGNLYCTALMPERFGRMRKYALGKTSGKASILKNLEELGIELDNDSIAKLTERIVELGDKKEYVTTEDLPYIISDVLGSAGIEGKIKIHNYYLCHAMNLTPVATLSIEIDGQLYEDTATGDGQYDAFMKAVGKIYKRINKPLPELLDYVVTIPPGGRTSALVETVITWRLEKEFKTRGLDLDQTASAIKATIRMLNSIEKT